MISILESILKEGKMETTVATVDEYMEGDIEYSEASQQIKDNQPSDIIESSKLELSSDIKKSMKFTPLLGVPCGMVGADFRIRFWNTPIPDIRCHKFILAARSEIFHGMFMESPFLKGWKIQINDLKEVTAQNMMKYIYTGTIGDVPTDTVSHHLYLANFFKLKPMGQLVQKKLIDSLDSSNCIQYLIMALSDPLLLVLKEKAIKTIVDNLSDLVTLEEWENLTKSQPSLTTEILRTYFMR